MTIHRREVPLFDTVSITASGQVVRSSQISCEGAQKVRLLLSLAEIGTAPDDGTLSICPIFIDEDGTEYIDADTTYGTIAITDSDTPVNKTVLIPWPTVFLALKITGGGTLTTSAGFKASARFVMIGNTPG